MASRKVLGISGRAVARIGIARKWRLEGQLLLDPLHAGRDQGRKCQVGVEVGSADATFDTGRLAPLAAQAKARRAIVAAPHRLGRGKGANLEALVGVDIGREKIGDLPCILELAGHEGAHQVRHAILRLRRMKQRLRPLLIPQREVDVRGGARQIVAPLRHEGDRLVLGVRDLLDRIFHDHVAVGHLQRIGIANVDLLLAGSPFSLRVLNGNTSAL